MVFILNSIVFYIVYKKLFGNITGRIFFTYNMPYYYEFYCNLNENSIHYNKFALMYDVDMLGEAFSIIEETCIEEILCKYNKMYNLVSDYLKTFNSGS